VSLAVRELFAQDEVLDEALSFAHELAVQGTAMQFIVYDTGDLARLVALHQRPGGFQGCPEVLLVLGSYASRRAGHPRDLLPLLAGMPEGWRWSACAFGASELACLATCAALGGGVRIGFENNVWLPDGRPVPDNATLVARLVQTLETMGLSAASTGETRARFFGA
jgi:3-keto-5-aminohexanoate cleavage enzyme